MSTQLKVGDEVTVWGSTGKITEIRMWNDIPKYKVNHCWWDEHQIIKAEPVERESEFKPGDEVEVSDNDNFPAYLTAKFLCKSTKGLFVAETDDYGNIYAWKYCRKPIPKKVKWNVWRDRKGETVLRKDGEDLSPSFWDIIKSFELDEK
jgi:hypothetical protein